MKDVGKKYGRMITEQLVKTIVDLVQGLSDEQLMAVLKYQKEVNPTNCWWAVYQITGTLHAFAENEKKERDAFKRRLRAVRRMKPNYVPEAMGDPIYANEYGKRMTKYENALNEIKSDFRFKTVGTSEKTLFSDAKKKAEFTIRTRKQ